MHVLSVSRTRCEYLENPLGIDETAPRLSWRIKSEKDDIRQSAYRITVASTLDGLLEEQPDLWDSGIVESDQTTQIPYEGEILTSRQTCWWQVRVRDNMGNEALSEPACWSMGLLEETDWTASWITADPEILRRDPEASEGSLTEPATPAMFRREFDLPGSVRKAVAYLSARGLVELRIDGKRVGEDLFIPEWTDYEHRIHYRTYDVTDLLTPGRNAIGAILGDGWWSGFVGWQEQRGRYGSLENSVLIQLEITNEDGSIQVIQSDPDWRTDTGAILSSDFMMGEIYDARRETSGWDQPGFSEENWLPAKIADPPQAPLVAQRSEPVRITQRLDPVSVNQVAPKTHVLDFGQNIAGWLHLCLAAAPGTTVTLRHAERLNPDGTLYTENLRRAKATDVITIGPSGEIDWQPHFTFHGFQYAEISGLPEAPDPETITACLVQSATPPSGEFSCAHEGVNRLWKNAAWSQWDNFLSVPTDCPQRDERLGWMGDGQIFLRTATYNADVAAFFTKWLQDVRDAQTVDGIFPDTAPRLREDINFVGLDDLGGGPAWADGGVTMPYAIWKVYGDLRIVEKSWDGMVEWMDYLKRTNPDYLRINELHNNYGDWLCLPSDREFRTQSPMKNLLATAYWALDASLMEEMAIALGKPDAERFYRRLFERIKADFQEEFLQPDGSLTVETQTAYLLALNFNLLPPEKRAAATEHLVGTIEARTWHLSTGFVGIKELNPCLTLNGRPDVAYTLLLQESYPGWLYPVRHGATTIWERWNGWTKKDGFFDPLMNSFNHYSLGSVSEWLFRHVAGIEYNPDSPGFQNFILCPYPDKRLPWASASYDTSHGTIRSRWEWFGNELDWEFTIPANCSAEVCIPAAGESRASLNDEPLQEATKGDRIRLNLGSGSYKTRSQPPIR